MTRTVELNDHLKRRQVIRLFSKCPPQCVSEDEDELPSEEFLKGIGVTKEEWSKMMRALRADEPHDDDLKGLGMSKEDVFSVKWRLACMNAFGIGFEEKMQMYWNAFRDGCKGRDVSEMG